MEQRHPASQRLMYALHHFEQLRAGHPEVTRLVALIHGVVLQQRCIQSDRQFQLTLIARRSR